MQQFSNLAAREIRASRSGTEVRGVAMRAWWCWQDSVRPFDVGSMSVQKQVRLGLGLRRDSGGCRRLLSGTVVANTQ